MGDVVFKYVAASASVQPVGIFVAADGAQSTVMNDIELAVNVNTTIILNRPTVVEQVSATVEAGKSYITMQFKSSPIIERVLFEQSIDRLAFMQLVLPQWAAVPVALGKPVQPETAWRDKQFQAAQEADVIAINEIDAAPDVQTRTILRDPLIQYIRSPTIRVNEIVMLINFPNTTDAFRVYVGSALDFMQFVQHFVIPLATTQAIGKNT